jgi:hypothetical protein
MKVQAMSNGYYCEQRIRKGDVFELKERRGFSKDERGNKVPYHYSVQSQFSDRWMRKVEDGQPVLPVEEDDLNLPGVKIKKQGKKRTLGDAGESVI